MAKKSAAPAETEAAPAEVSTTERLFGKQETNVSHGKPPAAKTISPEPPPEVNDPPVETPPATPAPVLTIEDLKGKKVKVKVGGVEMEVLGEDVIRGFQTDRFLTQKGQRLAEQERDIERRKTATPPAPVPAGPGAAAAPEPAIEIDPTASPEEIEWARKHVLPLIKQQIKEVESRVDSVDQSVRSLTQETHPARYERGLRVLESQMKEEGHDDFMDYVPKVESAITGMTEEERQATNTPEGFIRVFKDLKMRDLMNGKKPAPQGNQGKAENQERVPRVEGSGGGAPAGGDNSRANQLFQEAKRTGQWGPYFEHIGLLE